MSSKWADGAFDELQQGIERIRRLTERVSEAHDLVTANNQFLRRDRDLVRSGPLCESDDLRTHASQPLPTSAPAPRRKPLRTRRR